MMRVLSLPASIWVVSFIAIQTHALSPESPSTPFTGEDVFGLDIDEGNIRARQASAGAKCGAVAGNAICGAGLCCSPDVSLPRAEPFAVQLSKGVDIGRLWNRHILLRSTGLPVELWACL